MARLTGGVLGDLGRAIILAKRTDLFIQSKISPE
jgi:hypothetical protein